MTAAQPDNPGVVNNPTQSERLLRIADDVPANPAPKPTPRKRRVPKAQQELEPAVGKVTYVGVEWDPAETPIGAAMAQRDAK